VPIPAAQIELLWTPERIHTVAVEDIFNDLLANLHLLLLSLRELLEWLRPTALSLLPTQAWIEREEICDRIGHFLSQCLQGAHRGSSGRELLPNSNRIWIVVRDFEGLIYTPVRVFRNWTPAKWLVKPNNGNPAARGQHLRWVAIGARSQARCASGANCLARHH